MFSSNLIDILYGIENKYLLGKTLFLNKGSAKKNNSKRDESNNNLFDKLLHSTLSKSYILTFFKVRKKYGSSLQNRSKFVLKTFVKMLDFYIFINAHYIRGFFISPAVVNVNLGLISAKASTFKKLNFLHTCNVKYNFYTNKFLYKSNYNNLFVNQKFFVFVSKFFSKLDYANFFYKFFFNFNKKIQLKLNESLVYLKQATTKFSFSFFNKTLIKDDLRAQLNLLLKNYKYLIFNQNGKKNSNVKTQKTLVKILFGKIKLLLIKQTNKKQFDQFLLKLRYVFFLRKNFRLFFNSKKIQNKYFEKIKGSFKPLLKQYYKRYGRRFKRRLKGRLRMWHVFFLKNLRRKKKKKSLAVKHRRKYESWLIKTKRFVNTKKQFFHKQVFKYNYVTNVKNDFFKYYFKSAVLSNDLFWTTFRLRIIRFGPSAISKNIVRYQKYNLSNNFYLKTKNIKGRLANFFWRRSDYFKKNFLSRVDRYYKRMINFALDCLAPVGFMGAFRVKRQKKVLKRSFMTKNYRRYFLGAKLLVSLSKKNKRMADVEKLAFRVWHLWRFVNCGKKPKYFRDVLQKYYKPFKGVKTNQRLWKWRFASDRGTIFKHFYW